MIKKLALKSKGGLLLLSAVLGGCQSAQTITESRCVARGYVHNTPQFDACTKFEMRRLQSQAAEEMNKALPFLPTSPIPGVD